MDTLFNKSVKLERVKDLIKWLEILGRDRLLIYSWEGNTDSVYTSDVDEWFDPFAIDETAGDDSPICINSREV